MQQKSVKRSLQHRRLSASLVLLETDATALFDSHMKLQEKWVFNNWAHAEAREEEV